MLSYPPTRSFRVLSVLLFLSIVVAPLGISPRDTHSQGLTAPPEPYLVKDVYSQTMDSDPSHLTELNGSFYFSASDGIHGHELWKSDGTDAGTVMVKDLVPGAENSNPSGFQLFQHKLYFTISYHSDAGGRFRGLWMTDGTEQGTELVLDLGSGISWIEGATSDLLFFFYDDGVHGRELWALDGMGSPPYMVKDIRLDGQPIGASVVTETEHTRSAVLNGYLYFFIDDGIHGNELWRTDGTEEGTQLVVDATPGSDSTYPTSTLSGLIRSNDILYFHHSHSKTYWRVDGGDAQEIKVFSEESGHFIGQLIMVHQGNAYLSVVEEGMDYRNELGKLWVSDGTDGGVSKLQDVYHDFEDNSSESAAVALGDFVFLPNVSTDSDFENVELWRTDGTPAGTSMVVDIVPGEEGSVPIDLIVYQDHIYFFAYDDVHGTEFWRTDGTAFGTELVKDMNEGPLPSYDRFDYREYTPILVGETLFFKAYDEDVSSELWRSDGTAEGTWHVADINDATFNANPTDLTPVGDRLFFTSEFQRFNKNRTLWYTDGTEVGTGQVIDFTPHVGDSVHYELVAAGERLFVIAGGYIDPTPGFPYNDTTRFVELWVVEGDGTDAVLLASWEGLNEYWDLYAPVIFDDRFYGILTHEDAVGSYERQLWTSDGTIGGTSRGPNMPCLHYAKAARYSLRTWRDSLYCIGPVPDLPNDERRYQLWRSNGTDESIMPVPGVPVDMLSGVEMNGYLYFGGYEPMNLPDDRNIELWRSDGTAEGSTLVKEIDSSPIYGSSPEDLTVIEEQLFFRASTNDVTRQLWVTDGTTAGTKEAVPGTDLIAGLLGDGIGGELFFAGGTRYETLGGYDADMELWKSDGTESGTFLVADLAPGSEISSYPQNFALLGSILYFVTDTSRGNVLDRSLAVTDGTVDGTRDVMMIQEDDTVFADKPGDTIVVGDMLYFTAHTLKSGGELWAISHDPAVGRPDLPDLDRSIFFPIISNR